MEKMAPPKLVPPRTNFLITAKYGLLLKNLDHLTQMKNVDPSLTKFGPVASLGGFVETIQALKFSSTQCTSLIPGGTTRCIIFGIHCTIFFVNAA